MPRLRSDAPSALRDWRELLLGAALLGAGVTVLMWGPIFTQFERAGQAIAQSDGILFDPRAVLEAVWPHMRTWWFQAIGIAPAIAFGTEALRPKSVAEQLRSREEAEVRRRGRKERRARRSLGIEEPERQPQGFELGRPHLGRRAAARTVLAMAVKRVKLEGGLIRYEIRYYEAGRGSARRLKALRAESGRRDIRDRGQAASATWRAGRASGGQPDRLRARA